MQHFRNRASKNGFALPTILISSIVMLTVLLFSVSSTTAIRDSVQNQYYQQLAQTAGQAGVAYAEACLNANGGVPKWSNASPLQPNTDCSGAPLVSCPTTSTDPLCSVSLNGNVRASFSMGLPPAEAPSVLVVAGGGSGGGSTGGGGGAGGVVFSPSTSLAIGSYPIVIGSGGTIPGNQAPGQNGQNTTFNSIVAIGGGGGGYSAGGASGAAGQAGGSGGGGENYYGVYASGLGTTGQGNSGGSLGITSGSGGGGAGGVGGAGSTANTGGSGGSGISNTITGSPVYYGGGGGGGISGAAGVGGGGAGADVGGGGIANTGGGGGGGWSYASGNGGAGGSGIVILKYPTGLITASGGTPTTSGNYTIQTFTTSDTLNVTAVTGAVKTLPNTGFVQVLRSSSKQVWRTYQQTQAPPVAVPDLCSGTAKTIYGWNNASVTTTANSFPDAAALPISIGVGGINPGPVYYQKDFSITKAGTYTFTTAESDNVSFYIDGNLSAVNNSVTPLVQSTSLTAGCHTITASSQVGGILPTKPYIQVSLKLSGTTTPLIISDTSWRVSAGSVVPFSSPYYFADPNTWAQVRDITPAYKWSSGWTAFSGDSYAQELSTVNSNSGGSYPASQYAIFRDSRVINVTTATDVQLSYQCDDSCTIYLDGNQVGSATLSNQVTTTLNLTEGNHNFGVVLYNAGIAANPSGFAFSVKRVSDGVLMTRSDSSWLSTNYWNPTATMPYSYDATYVPNPNQVQGLVYANVLVTAGGGGGATNAAGGGGGGGVLKNMNYQLSVGSSTITIGSGGVGGSVNGVAGLNGSNSSFGSLIAIGGGGGAARDGGSNAGNGGSGGGGAGTSTSRYLGGAGTSGQGNSGGNGTGPTDQGCSSTGGGGGGSGGIGAFGIGTAGSNTVTDTIAGNGGAGRIDYITGVPVIYGSGGGGSITCNGALGSADVGGGAGGLAGTPNRGGGGSANFSGGPGTQGGSGIVIISFPAGSVTASATGTDYSITSPVNGNTIFTFRANGTFTVSSIP